MLAEGRSSLRSASIAIERNPAYLHQFVNRGTPRTLAEDDREALADHLGCSPDLFRHDRKLARGTRSKPAPANGPHSAPRGYCAVPDPPRVVLKSLNPDYDSYERPAEEVRVVGRAVWVARRLQKGMKWISLSATQALP